jgi:hypothetical protein
MFGAPSYPLGSLLPPTALLARRRNKFVAVVVALVLVFFVMYMIVKSPAHAPVVPATA